jgi:predicted nucleic acid-binding protein
MTHEPRVGGPIDANGNLTGDGTRTFEWNAANRLLPGTEGSDRFELQSLRPPELRSLDAIHLATAQELGDELRALVTYDDGMVTAAKHLGYRIVQPR